MSLFECKSDTIFKILEKYQRKEKSFENDVEYLKNWMRTQAHLPEILDEKSIGNFLILNKFSIEKTKQKIDMYYTLRTKIPDIFECSNPKCKNISDVFDLLFWIPLPTLTEENYRILLFKIQNKNFYDKLDPYDVTRFALNVQELRLKKDIMFGDIVIYDMEGINLNYLIKLTPSIIAKVYTIYEKVFSISLKGLYIINSPPFVSKLLTILKSVMKPKLYERVHVCENYSILEKFFPKNILPKDYGGEEKSLKDLHEILRSQLKHLQDRFDLLDHLRVDKNLRSEKLRNDEILGFYGNFKKLEVD